MDSYKIGDLIWVRKVRGGQWYPGEVRDLGNDPNLIHFSSPEVGESVRFLSEIRPRQPGEQQPPNPKSEQ